MLKLKSLRIIAALIDYLRISVAKHTNKANLRINKDRHIFSELNSFFC